VIVVFGIFVTAGATKIIYVVTVVSKLLAQELPLLKLPLDALEAILGIALVWAGVALFKARVQRRWILQSLLVLTALFELGEVAYRSSSGSIEFALVSSHAINWVAYLVAFFLLSAASVRNYSTPRSTDQK
jgi:hypothetical protein